MRLTKEEREALGIPARFESKDEWREWVDGASRSRDPFGQDDEPEDFWTEHHPFEAA